MPEHPAHFFQRKFHNIQYNIGESVSRQMGIEFPVNAADYGKFLKVAIVTGIAIDGHQQAFGNPADMAFVPFYKLINDGQDWDHFTHAGFAPVLKQPAFAGNTEPRINKLNEYYHSFGITGCRNLLRETLKPASYEKDYCAARVVGAKYNPTNSSADTISRTALTTANASIID